MEISAQVRNEPGQNAVCVSTAGSTKSLDVPSRESGLGSSVNGGELLMLALATCYCNDLYREAQRLGIAITGCEVIASAQFEAVWTAQPFVDTRRP